MIATSIGSRAPLRRATALVIVGFALIGAGLVWALHLPLALALVGAPLTAVIGAQWLMLSVGGGMMSPVVLLRAFGVGAPLSLIAALAVERAAPAGGAGYLFGFAAGQLVTLALLVRGVARALPAATDESAQLLPGLRRVQAARLVGVRVLRVDLGRQGRRLCRARRRRGRVLRGDRRGRLVLGDSGVRLDLRSGRDGLLPAVPQLLRRAGGRARRCASSSSTPNGSPTRPSASSAARPPSRSAPRRW